MGSKAVHFLVLLSLFGQSVWATGLDDRRLDAATLQLKHISTPSNPSSGKSKLYSKSDGKLYTLDSSGNEVQVGTGAGGGGNGINYIANPDAESGTTGWNLFADSAANIPTDGTGGTATGLTFTRSTSSPLRGVGSFVLQQTNSTNLQGKGVSYDYSIDSADQGHVLSVQFDFNASTTFVASDGSTTLNDGTTSTTSGNSDLEVFDYDVTNSALIYVSPEVITAKGSNNYTFKGSFQTLVNSTSHRLIFHVATTNANATGWTFKFDNVSVGPQAIVNGSPITDWVSCPINFIALGTVSGNQAFCRRIGDSLQVRGEVTTGTTTGSGVEISLPYNASIDPTKVSSTTKTQMIGIWQNLNSGPSNLFDVSALASGQIYVDTSDLTHVYLASQSDSTPIYANVSGSSLGNGNALTYEFTFPVIGQSSNVQMSSDTDTRVVAAKYQASSTQTPGTNAPINFDVPYFDTHGAVTTGSNWKFIAPISGKYSVKVVVGATNATVSDIFLFKNGSADSFLTETIVGTTYVSGSTDVILAAGEYIDIRPDGATQFAGGTAGNTSVSINRISGPAAIAASESVGMSASLSSDTVFNSTTVVYDSVQFDSHFSYSPSTGTFTLPMPGTYSVSVLGAATSGSASLLLDKNGSHYAYLTSINTSGQFSGTTLIKGVAGDILNISTAANVTIQGLSSGIILNSFSIHRVGN